MSHHFVFVHGAGHGGWCWYKLSTMLKAARHETTCIDLSGAGINLTDPNTITSLDEYDQPLYNFLNALPDNEKVILVGHSIGGGSVTSAMVKYPHRVSMAVYLAAAMVKPGLLSPPEIKKIYMGEPEGIEGIWDFIYGNGPHKPPTSMIMKEKYIRQKYYNQSPMQDYMLSTTLLRPAPISAFEDIAGIPAAPQIDSIPRVYLKTAKDNMFKPLLQGWMVDLWPPSQVFVLEESDHSGFFSAPEAVYACLLQAASSLSS